MKRSIIAAGAITVLIGLVAAGCGPASSGTAGNGPNGGDQAAKTAAKNPCELMSTAELATIVAKVDKLSPAPAITQTGPVGEFQGRECTFSYPKAELVTDTAEVSVTAWRGLAYYTPDATGGFTAVPGIGDAAHQQSSMFMFRKGDDVFLVTVIGDANLEVLRPEIAKLIASKL